MWLTLAILQVSIANSICPVFKEASSTYGVTSTAGVRVDLTDGLNNDNAACLDGSVGVFYYRKGSGDGTSKFHVFLEGGGACAGFEEQVIDSFDTCIQRAGTSLGSSTSYPDTADYDSGYLSTDKSTNPLTYNWNTIYVKYCDGSCYSGNNDTIVKINDTLSLHFTGYRILNSVFEELMNDNNNKGYNFDNATDLLLSGCSAGGLGTYIHNENIFDMINAKMGNQIKMAAMPDSGFFLEYQGKGMLMTGVQWQFDYFNSSASLNEDCIKKKSDEYKYLCIFAQETVPYNKYNTLGLQSQYDLWQTGNMLVSGNFGEINDYGQNLSATIFDTYLNNGDYKDNHSIFLSSCAYHCGEWNDIVIDGYKASQAQYDWYNGNFTAHSRIWYQNETYPCLRCCDGGQVCNHV